MVALVRGVAGLVRSVSFDDGLVSARVFVPAIHDYVVLRHRVGARGGIPVTASRDLWRTLVAARNEDSFVEFSGRPGWDGWFDAAGVVTFVTEGMMNVYYDGEEYCPA
jgi:hypothetical protein